MNLLQMGNRPKEAPQRPRHNLPRVDKLGSVAAVAKVGRQAEGDVYDGRLGTEELR